VLLFDASHTSHTRAHTGIQRVVRALYATLHASGPVTAVCFDPHFNGWRTLDSAETETLSDRTGRHAATSRGARWSLARKISGHARRLIGDRGKLPAARGLVCPELFSPRVGARLPELFVPVAGPRVALFHDAIGLKYPELTPSSTVTRLPAYLRELLQFDGIAAVSEDSAASLRDFWQWLGVNNTPPVETIPLGLDERHLISDIPAGPIPRVLCVATIEGRKNHLALLEAADALWREGLAFELELIGLARPDTAGAALEKIAALRAAGRPLIYHGSVAENSLHAAYARCAFTIYPSLCEGFGLPVFESLQHGKPCVCSAHGALGEAARGGGVLALDSLDAASVAGAMRRLLAHPAEHAELVAAARQRSFRSWNDYARDLTNWMATLPGRR
jgi:glycosyltransferase involved in cell wall biosynthesis